jgi:hypothetical protein
MVYSQCLADLHEGTEMATDDVTLGEVFRLCQRIEEKVNLTNGRTGLLEQKVAVLESNSGGASKKVTAVSGGVGAGLVILGEFLWKKLGG